MKGEWRINESQFVVSNKIHTIENMRDARGGAKQKAFNWFKTLIGEAIKNLLHIEPFIEFINFQKN